MAKAKSPSFRGLKSASPSASLRATKSSAKTNTRCEIALRRALWKSGYKYRLHCDLPGTPDIVFRKFRTVVFCDGDYWHGRNLRDRLIALRKGHNAEYWVAKIANNVKRDRATNEALRAKGWKVIRVWETDILRNAEETAKRIINQLTST